MLGKMQNAELSEADRAQLRQSCRDTTEQLTKLSMRLEQKDYSADVCRAVIGALAEGELKNWADAAQRYNAMVALHQQMPNRQELRDELSLLHQALTARDMQTTRFDHEELSWYHNGFEQRLTGFEGHGVIEELID